MIATDAHHIILLHSYAAGRDNNDECILTLSWIIACGEGNEGSLISPC